MRYLLSITISFLLVGSAAIAQSIDNTQTQSKPHHHRLDRMQSFLNLTDVQMNQIKTELSNLKSEENISHHRAMKQAMSKVLTPKQLEQLNSKESWRKHRKPRRHMWHKEDSEVKAKLLEMRKSLDNNISDEDQATISQLRVAREEMHASFKMKRNTFSELSSEDKAQFKKRFHHSERRSSPHFVQARAMAEKYSEEIVDLFEENEQFFMEMKIAKRAEKAKLDSPRRSLHCTPVPRESRELGQDHSLHKLIAFLLMGKNQDNNKVAENKAKLNTIKLYPNPTSDRTQISFTIKSPSDITVDIKDAQGRLVQGLINQYYEIGEYEEEVNTSTLESGIYLVSFYDGVTVQTEKLIIQR